MKKNITMNLFGSLYAIDEDAYELLNRYEANLRAFFARKEGGEEIAADIEARIAELLEALKQEGVEAITIEHVEAIIQRIGNPEQLHEGDSEGEEAPSSAASAQTGEKIRKRFFRDPEDKLLSGLMGGFARYFGGDPLWWRLGMVAFFLLSWGTALVAYLLLWILVPLARTPEELLQMQGKPVTPGNIGEEVMRGMRRAGEYMRRDETKSTLRRFGETLLQIVACALKWFLYLLVGGTVLAILVFLISFFFWGLMGSAYETSALSGFDENVRRPVEAVFSAYPLAGWFFGLSALMVLCIPFYGLFHRMLRQKRHISPMGTVARIVWALVWLLFLAVGINSGTYLLWQMGEMESENWQANNLHNGIYIAPHEWEYLEDEGWTIVKSERCNDRYLYSGQYYTGDTGVKYLDTYNRSGRQVFRAERRDTLAAGLYRLTVAGRANGEGGFIYARAEGTPKVYWAEIPADEAEGGNIWKEARARLEAEKDASWSVRQTAEANDGRGYGWNRVVIDSVQVSSGVLRYGVSTDPSFTGHTWQGQWFSVCDFVLTRIGDLPQTAKKP